MAGRDGNSVDDRGASDGLARILCVESDEGARGELAEAVRTLPLVLHDVCSMEAARNALVNDEYDVVLIDADAERGAWVELARERLGSPRPTRAILTTTNPTVESAIDAMRAGAIDVIRKPFEAEEVASRVLAAVERADDIRRQQRRIDQLKRICRRLDSARQEVTREVNDLCDDLVSAYREIAEQMATPEGEATDFGALVGHELDVEALLRVTLEYILSITGPTNAAVFLPTGVEDFALGAYVNYDLPREDADFILDHLADVIPDRFMEEPGPVVMVGREAIEDRDEDVARLLGDASAVVLSCRRDGDCLAVIALFRGERRPFDEETAGRLASLRDSFAGQLARAIRVHNRHRDPDDLVPGFDIDLGDSDDLDGPELDFPDNLAA